MENKVKVNLWVDHYYKELQNSPLVDFNPNQENILRMANRQYDEIFRLLSLGKTIRIANLELLNKTLSQAINEAENEDSQNNRVSIFTSEDYHSQNNKLESLLESKQDLYLTFGLLDYFEDNRMVIKSAPLVLMPIRLEKLESDIGYQISMIEHELRLNDALVHKLLTTRRVDISYPLENDFSLIEFLTYVATKVRNNHFSVNNGCFITSLDATPYYLYEDLNTRKNEIASLPLVKSVSYLNAEFFNFNKSSSMKLKHNFLSLLDLDNDEYKILKRINLRENVVIKTNILKNKQHIITNVLNDFLLNDKNVLITYDDEDAHKEILQYIKESKLEEFTCDLSAKYTSKKQLINRLISQDRLEFDAKLLDSKHVDEIVDTYYLLKNNYKKLINSLRKSNDSFKLSINRAIYEYYSLKDLPLVNVEIPNADIIDEIKLKEYTDSISNYVLSINNLKCHYLDHPFYGFNNLTMSQEQYLALKEKLISLSAEFAPAKKAFSHLSVCYGFPFPKSLKEMKGILNILSLIPECAPLSNEWFEIEDYASIQTKLATHNTLFNDLLALRSKIISIYEDKVFLLDHNLLKQNLSNKPLTRKMIKSYQPYFMKKAKVDESILTHLSEELNEYYILEAKVNDLLNETQLFKEFYSEGIYDLTAIHNRLLSVRKFKEYCNYVSTKDELFSYSDLAQFNEEKLLSLASDRKNCQIAFNHLLHLVNEIQKDYDSSLMNMGEVALTALEKRITDASKNFSSINAYLDFYLTAKKLNRLLPKLPQQLLAYPQTETYVSIFMKRFYYDFANAAFNNNPLFAKYDDKSFMQNINNYQEYNSSRVETINTLIKSNIKHRIHDNTIEMRSIEGPYLSMLNNEEIKVLPLSQLLAQVKTTIKTLFPIIIMPLKEVSASLYNQNYRFDLNIILANDKMLTREVVPSASRCDQTIVMDYRLIQGDEVDAIVRQSSELFISSALQSLTPITYISSSYQSNVLKANTIDVHLKAHIAERLRKENFVIAQDVNTDLGTIDLLVKVPNSSRPTAIIIDRLGYYSLESTIDSFEQTQAKIDKLGYAGYRLITSIYFRNEDQEFRKLVDFIIKNTVKETNTQKVSKIRPLVDVLFDVYEDPSDVYYNIYNKTEKSSVEIMLELLAKTAPVLKDTIISVVGESAISTLATLQVEKQIRISNGFIFLEDESISFRRVVRDGEYRRPLNSVSNEELSAGIVKLVSQRTLKEEDVIKLMLLSLGMKKMNHSQYFRIENIIAELLEEKILFRNENSLYYQEITNE